MSYCGESGCVPELRCCCGLITLGSTSTGRAKTSVRTGILEELSDEKAPFTIQTKLNSHPSIRTTNTFSLQLGHSSLHNILTTKNLLLPNSGWTGELNSSLTLRKYTDHLRSLNAQEQRELQNRMERKQMKEFMNVR